MGCCLCLGACLAVFLCLAVVAKQRHCSCLLHLLLIVLLVFVVDVPMAFVKLLSILGLITRRQMVIWNSKLIWYAWASLCWSAEKGQNMQVTFSGDIPLPQDKEEGGTESGVLISNHQGYCDVFLITSLTMRHGMAQCCKFFAKKSLLFLPGFGWAMKLQEFITLSRDWNKDRKGITKVFSSVVGNRLPSLLCIYPEGTRQNRKKMAESQEFCKRKGIKPLDNLLYPKLKGFTSSIIGIRGSHIKHVYDLTLIYSQKSQPGEVLAHPSMTQLFGNDLTAKGYRFHVHVRRYSISDLPEGEGELGKWLEDRWREKDVIIGEAHKEGKWPGEPKSSLPAKTIPLGHGSIYL